MGVGTGALVALGSGVDVGIGVGVIVAVGVGSDTGLGVGVAAGADPWQARERTAVNTNQGTTAFQSCKLILTVTRLRLVLRGTEATAACGQCETLRGGDGR